MSTLREQVARIVRDCMGPAEFHDGYMRAAEDAANRVLTLPEIRTALERQGEERTVLEAVARELRNLRPGLDRPHNHRGVQREKVDAALAMAERMGA